MTKPPARLIIADDHELARAGVRAMLDGAHSLTIVGEASNGHEAVALCQQFQPDLIVLDVRMPELDGLAAARAIRDASPHTRVLILTTQESSATLLAALNAGATGYVLKDVTRHDLLRAIRRVLRGESVLRGELAERALRGVVDEHARPTKDAAEVLTPREREVLEQIAEGHTNRQIAVALGISIGTVKSYVEHIIGKLGVLDRTQAAVWAVEHGLRREHQEAGPEPRPGDDAHV